MRNIASLILRTYAYEDAGETNTIQQSGDTNWSYLSTIRVNKLQDLSSTNLFLAS